MNDESIIELGALVDEIYFKKIPDRGLLNKLCEGSENIRIHLPLDKAADWFEYGKILCSGNIISANFKTDIFNDINYIFHFSNLENLTLTCNSSVDEIYSKDVTNTQDTIAALKPFKTLTFNLCRMKEKPVQQIKDNMRFVGFDAVVQYTDRNLNKSKKNVQTHINKGV